LVVSLSLEEHSLI